MILLALKGRREAHTHTYLASGKLLRVGSTHLHQLRVGDPLVLKLCEEVKKRKRERHKGREGGETTERVRQ